MPVSQRLATGFLGGPMPLEINFTPAPTVARFMRSDAKMRVLMGPVGSGKSVGSCFETVAFISHFVVTRA